MKGKQLVRVAIAVLMFSGLFLGTAIAQDTRLSRPLTTTQAAPTRTRIYTISDDALRKMVELNVIKDTTKIGSIRPSADPDAEKVLQPEVEGPGRVPGSDPSLPEVQLSKEQIQQQLTPPRRVVVRKSDAGVSKAELGGKLENIRRYKDWQQLNESYSIAGMALPNVVPIFKTSPLRFDPVSETFRTTVRVALFDPLRSQATALPEPMKFFFSSDRIDAITPDELVFDSTNGVSRTLELVEDNPRKPVMFQMYTYAQPEGADILVDIEPVLLFASRHRVLQGWGLESVPITVLLRGADTAEHITINFSAERGSFTPPTMMLRGGEFATVHLRSQGTGPTTILVTSPQYSTQTMSMTYAFPWMFFLIALGGGLIGSVISWLLRKSTDATMHPVRFLTGWTLFGLVAAVLYIALGINIIGIDVNAVDFFNEMLVFGISALAPIAWSMIRGKGSAKPAAVP